jgi:putative Holliday junction resolvase
MRYLGLDLGTKTLGVAISDKTNSIASFLKVIRFKSEDYEYALKELIDIIKNYNITHIALGLPKNMDNSCGFAANRSLKFKELIEKNTNIEVKLIDERLTTIEAENILIGMDKKRKERKKVIDGMSACLILEAFIKERENNNG